MRFAVSIKAQAWALRKSTFLMNAFYLMASTFAASALGFVFWVIIARSHPSGTVGLATTLLSVSGLLSMLGLAGFDTTFVRFLPNSKRRNDHINSGLLIVTLLSGLLALGFVLSLPLTSPSLAFVLHNGWYLASFVFFTIVTSLNVLTNAVFLARKQARDICIINLLAGVFKVALPLLAMRGGVMAIFAMAGISQFIGLVLSLMVMKMQFGYVFTSKIHLDILRFTWKYSFSVYLSSILNLLPPTLLPLIVVHKLGPQNAAYYYIVFTIASALYTVAYASTQSAFVEGSHDEAAMEVHSAKAVRLIVVLLVPAVLITIGLSHFILKVFGAEYAAGGSALLRLFAVSAIAVAACSTMGAIFKVAHNLQGAVVMNVVYAVVILGLSYLLIPHFGILAVGWSWIAGTTVAAGTGLVFLRRHSKAATRGGE